MLKFLWSVVVFVLTVGLVFAVFALLVFLADTSTPAPKFSSLEILVASLVLFAFLGVFPFTFYAYQTYRKESKIERLTDDFWLLGLINQDDDEEVVSRLYDRVYNWKQYVLYIGLILVFSTIVLALYASLNEIGRPLAQQASAQTVSPTSVAQTNADSITTELIDMFDSEVTTSVMTSTQSITLITLITTTAIISPEQPITLTTALTTSLPEVTVGTAPVIPNNTDVIRLLLFAYLGAYIYSVLELIRRYNTFDLQPQVYASILARMVAAVVLVFVGAVTIFNASSTYQAPEAAPGFATLWLPGIIAFVIGAFPSSGLDWFRRLAEPSLGGRNGGQPTALPLDNLLGMSSWHASRFQQVGFDDAQNLAGADLAELLLTTQFDAQILVNWVDQAILYTKVGDDIDMFRKQKICTFTGLKQSLLAVQQQTETVEKLAAQLGLANGEQLERLADETGFANYHHLAEYYLRKEEVTHQYAQDAQNAIIGKVEYENHDDAIRFGERKLKWLKAGGKMHRNELLGKWLLLVGKAYYQRAQACIERGESDKEKINKDLESAIACFSEAVKLESAASETYSLRAQCRLERFSAPGTKSEQEWQYAVNDCTKAIALDRCFATAFTARASAYHKLGQVELARQDLDEALRLDDRLAVAYYKRGNLRLELAQYVEAQADFEKANLSGYADRGGIKEGLYLAYLGQRNPLAEQLFFESLGLLNESRQQELKQRYVYITRKALSNSAVGQ